MTINKQNYRKQTGYVLVSILIVGVMTSIITIALVSLIIVNSRNASQYSLSTVTLASAESGVENAILRLLRDPTYAGEIMVLDDNTVVITVSGDAQKIINAEATDGNFVRKVEVVADLNQGVLSIVSWEEIY